MRTLRHIAVIAGLTTLVLGGLPGVGAAQVSTLAPNRPHAHATPEKAPPGSIPQAPEPGISGSSREPLSDKLERQRGVIHPPADLDPGLTQAPPATGPQSMPVIPPPGTPGGRTDVNPK
jgi:hypothetical protein